MLWAANRADPERPVQVTLHWHEAGAEAPQRFDLLAADPDRLRAKGVLAHAVPLDGLPEGRDVAVRLTTGGKPLRRGTFRMRRVGAQILLWRLARLTDGGILGTVVGYPGPRDDPGDPLSLIPEITRGTDPDAEVLWRGAQLVADGADPRDFAFGGRGHSFALPGGDAAPDGLPAALDVPDAALRLRLHPGTRMEQCNTPVSVSCLKTIELHEDYVT